jgi:uncharacterized protein YndB with AHSA1/START domain
MTVGINMLNGVSSDLAAGRRRQCATDWLRIYEASCESATKWLRNVPRAGRLALVEPHTVTRSAHLDAGLDRVWDALARTDGLAGWLADSVDVVIEPGAAGTVVDGSVTRRIVVTEVDERRHVGFTWWDDAAPDHASAVRIAIESGEDGGTTVTVTETLDPAASAVLGGRASALSLAAIGDLGLAADEWIDRLARLVGAVATVPALAGA